MSAFYYKQNNSDFIKKCEIKTERKQSYGTSADSAKSKMENAGISKTDNIAENPSETKNTNADGWKVQEKDFSLLVNIAEKPYLGIHRRGKYLKMSSRNIYACKDNLQKNGLINPVLIQLKNSRTLLFDITQEGKNILENRGIKIKKCYRHGNIKHEFFVHQIGAIFESEGWIAKFEEPAGQSKTYDILIEKEGMKKAV